MVLDCICTTGHYLNQWWLDCQIFLSILNWNNHQFYLFMIYITTKIYFLSCHFLRYFSIKECICKVSVYHIPDRKIIEKRGEGLGKLHVSSPNLIYLIFFHISRCWDLKSHKPNRNTDMVCGLDSEFINLTHKEIIWYNWFDNFPQQTNFTDGVVNCRVYSDAIEINTIHWSRYVIILMKFLLLAAPEVIILLKRNFINTTFLLQVWMAVYHLHAQ